MMPRWRFHFPGFCQALTVPCPASRGSRCHEDTPEQTLWEQPACFLKQTPRVGVASFLELPDFCSCYFLFLLVLRKTKQITVLRSGGRHRSCRPASFSGLWENHLHFSTLGGSVSRHRPSPKPRLAVATQCSRLSPTPLSLAPFSPLRNLNNLEGGAHLHHLEQSPYLRVSWWGKGFLNSPRTHQCLLRTRVPLRLPPEGKAPSGRGPRTSWTHFSNPLHLRAVPTNSVSLRTAGRLWPHSMCLGVLPSCWRSPAHHGVTSATVFHRL